MSSTVGVGGHGSGYGAGAGGVGPGLGASSLGSSLHESRLDAMPSEKAPAISSSSRPSFVPLLSPSLPPSIFPPTASAGCNTDADTNPIDPVSLHFSIIIIIITFFSLIHQMTLWFLVLSSFLYRTSEFQCINPNFFLFCFGFGFVLGLEKRKEAPDSSEGKLGDGRGSSLGGASANTPTSSSHGGKGGSKRSRR